VVSATYSPGPAMADPPCEPTSQRNHRRQPPEPKTCANDATVSIFRAKKNHLNVEPKLKQSDDVKKILEEAPGLDLMGYDNHWGRYRIRPSPGDVEVHEALLKDLLRRAYKSLEAGD
jgi:hypothetical protein